MVAWGPNSVTTFSSASPASNLGATTPGAPAPPTSSIFGGAASSPVPAFGAPPASSFGSSSTSAFGSSPAPAFGASPTPASSGIFGSTTTTSAFGAPTSSIFGNTTSSTSLFGGTTSSTFGGTPAASPFGGFGATQQQQAQQPHIPAQAAMHAHMEAMNRAETEKIKVELGKLYATYEGTITPNETSRKKASFVTILYNDLTQEQRQMQWMHGMAAGGKIMPIAPQRPQQLSEEEWNKAVVQNPHPMSYMPVAIVGAEALNARVTWQQNRAQELAKQAELIKSSHETAQKLFNNGRKRLEEIKRAHANHRKRLLNIMRKVEVVRCMNQPLQPDEVRAMERLRDIDKQVREVRHLLGELENRAKTAVHAAQHQRAQTIDNVAMPDREQLAKVLGEHREELKKLSLALQKDTRDVDLMKERVVPQLGHPSSR